MVAIDFPSSPTNGQVFGNYTYDSVVGVWRATTQATPGLPAGTIVQWPTATAPNNWVICDGAALSRTTYASLFAAIGTQYGVGDGSTTFNIPNLKGRVVVGQDASQTEFDVLGETGGAKTHTLQVSEMPSHTHVQDSHNHTQNAHNHDQNSHYHQIITRSGVVMQHELNGGSSVHGTRYNSNMANELATASSTATNIANTATNNATTATNQNTGGGGAHNNLQPYIVLNYIIKTSAGATAKDSELAVRVGTTEATDVTQNARLTALETAVPSTGWTAYTPSFSNITIGNGSTAFYYQKIGKVVHVRGLITYGSTTSFNGACDFSHPAMATTYNILHPMGYVEFYGSGLRHGRIVRINDTYSRFVCDVVSGTTVSNGELSNTYPFTWTSGYWAMLSMSYETG